MVLLLIIIVYWHGSHSLATYAHLGRSMEVAALVAAASSRLMDIV